MFLTIWCRVNSDDRFSHGNIRIRKGKGAWRVHGFSSCLDRVVNVDSFFSAHIHIIQVPKYKYIQSLYVEQVSSAWNDEGRGERDCPPFVISGQRMSGKHHVFYLISTSVDKACRYPREQSCFVAILLLFTTACRQIVHTGLLESWQSLAFCAGASMKHLSTVLSMDRLRRMDMIVSK